MTRRTWIAAVSAGIGVCHLGTMGGCGGGSAALRPWGSAGRGFSDVRLRASSYAILAPSPHNRQPWRIRLRGAEWLDLFVDETRANPHTDHVYRQLYVAQGAFLELLTIAATLSGHRADIEYFPDGSPPSNRLDLTTVASIRFARDPSVEANPLAASIPLRQSNKRSYERDHPPTPEELAQWQWASHDAASAVSFTADSRTTKEIGRLALEAIRIEGSNIERHQEIVASFRFSASEVERTHDGFTVAQSGVTGFRRWMAENLFLSRDDAGKLHGSFAKSGLDLAREQIESTSAWGWITTPNNGRIAQITAGRTYARSSLAAARLGLAQHPMSQLMQEYPEVESQRAELGKLLAVPEGHTVQMLFRLGHAPPVEHTARRELHEVLAHAPV